MNRTVTSWRMKRETNANHQSDRYFQDAPYLFAGQGYKAALILKAILAVHLESFQVLKSC